MLQWILLLTLSGMYIYWMFSRYHRVWKHIAKFPGPVAVPIFGNVLQIGFSPEMHMSSIRRWVKQYNYEIFRMYAGPQPYLVLSNPQNVEHLLSSTVLTYKYDIYEFMRPWLGRGLLTSNGTHWSKHRKLITRSFHFQILQDFLHIINETTDRFMVFLEQFADEGEMFDFQEIVTRSTLDVILETAMGTRLNIIGGNQAPIAKAINDLCFVIHERMFSAAKRSDLLFSCTSAYRLQKHALQVMYREMSTIITKRREMLQQLSSKLHVSEDECKRPKMAFLDNLLTAEVDGQPLSFQDIFEEVCTFVFEGHDTTASALSFATFCLSRHPQIQQNAFNEQVQLLGVDAKRNPTYQDLQKMKYLERIIRETLRLFPSVPLIVRTTNAPTVLGGHTVPTGTALLLPIISLGTNEHSFEEPFAFRPERFEADKRERAHAFDNVPFSAGPRNCIGQKFAMMELKITLSKILRNFHVLPAVDGLPSGIHDPADPADTYNNPYDPRLAVLTTLKSVNGVYVRLQKRV